MKWFRKDHNTREENPELERAVDEAVDSVYEEELQKINDQLDKAIKISLDGVVNAGMFTEMYKIIGRDVASMVPRPGETISIDPYNIEGLKKIQFMDTPGLNDPNYENPRHTLRFIQEADIVLFFTNAAGTVF